MGIWTTSWPGGDIARQIRKKAEETRGLARELREHSGRLDSSWEGMSKLFYMSEIRPLISKLEDYASWLDRRADEIAKIEVREPTIGGSGGDG